MQEITSGIFIYSTQPCFGITREWHTVPSDLLGDEKDDSLEEGESERKRIGFRVWDLGPTRALSLSLPTKHRVGLRANQYRTTRDSNPSVLLCRRPE